jgi:cell division protein ZapA
MKRLEVAIGGRVFPLKVEEEEVAVILETVDEINEKLRNLQSTYSNNDMQDCLSMLILTYAVEHRNSPAEQDTSVLESSLSQVEQMLGDLIS